MDKDLSLIFNQEAEVNSVGVTITPTSSVVSLSPQHKLQDEDDSHCDVNNSIQNQHNPILIDHSSQSAYVSRPSLHMSHELYKVERIKKF